MNNKQNENIQKIVKAIKEVYGDGQEYVELKNTIRDLKAAYEQISK